MQPRRDSGAPSPVRTSRGVALLLAALSAAIVVYYAWTARASRTDWGNIEARGAFYNLLVDGFAAGQLHLKTEVPADLAALTDPNDPKANARFRIQGHLHDTSFYNGKLYIYFGVTPAVVLFGPYHALTGGYLFNKDAAFVFCSVTFLAGVLLVHACWRRCFPDVRPIALAGAVLILGLASGAPLLLRTPAICEIAIACAMAFMLLAALALWRAWHDDKRSLRWLALASLSYGLAVGARPSVLFGGLVLLVPVWRAWRGSTSGEARRFPWRIFAAAVLPIACVGLALAWYNHARFGSIFEFGQRYQLAGDRQDAALHFSPGYLAYNLRSYFFAFAPWGTRFPFVDLPVHPAPPSGHAPPESGYGLLANTPILWLALGSALAWRMPGARAGSDGLRPLLGILAWWFASAVLLIGCFYGTVLRYEYEFAPPLAVLACVGLFTLEQHPWRTARTRTLARLGWGVALIFSAAFVVLTNLVLFVEDLNKAGVRLALESKPDEALQYIARALRLKPHDLNARRNLAQLHLTLGHHAEAAQHYELALVLEPRSAEVQNQLGLALLGLGRDRDALARFKTAAELDPTLPIPAINAGTILLRLGRAAEAVPYYETALRLAPEASGLREALELARREAGK